MEGSVFLETPHDKQGLPWVCRGLWISAKGSKREGPMVQGRAGGAGIGIKGKICTFSLGVWTSGYLSWVFLRDPRRRPCFLKSVYQQPCAETLSPPHPCTRPHLHILEIPTPVSSALKDPGHHLNVWAPRDFDVYSLWDPGAWVC